MYQAAINAKQQRQYKVHHQFKIPPIPTKVLEVISVDHRRLQEIHCYLIQIGVIVPVSVINKILADAINIYPNPAYNFIKIELNSNSLSSPNTIELFRLDGQLVKKVSIEDTTIEIDISDLTPGIYLLSCTQSKRKSLH